ncbi:hypothetical protein AV530_016808 [Patagioenas fasciata monilis]|uniref:Uncharacterized protein n=1 Tax=Patagioenas fasciata monilis TaxID=372326 RepID=A0A1V4J3U5_PATFA|nr:hypothetical protein AV530_016808 [Patagioenas fasciata monilis]
MWMEDTYRMKKGATEPQQQSPRTPHSKSYPGYNQHPHPHDPQTGEMQFTSGSHWDIPLLHRAHRYQRSALSQHVVYTKSL